MRELDDPHRVARADAPLPERLGGVIVRVRDRYSYVAKKKRDRYVAHYDEITPPEAPLRSGGARWSGEAARAATVTVTSRRGGRQHHACRLRDTRHDTRARAPPHQRQRHRDNKRRVAVRR